MPSLDPKQVLAQQLRELIRLYLLDQRRHTHALGYSQHHRLLMLLLRSGPLTQGEFGRVAGLDKSWISRIVDRFVEEGLVTREPLPEDRRCLQLHLTKTGLAEARKFDALLTARTEGLFAGIPDDQHGLIGAALESLVQGLRVRSEEL
ncbi:MarR family winged helix-turn-helix transcriptional regulator [Uliginosibacterium sp. 31-12]|uniref:MarR family winged helix-turn-helix transcriptional regulator n=1 Tax=Uliginosibacterium sp. 31-12 TaxID=3062781 RepID=UPI0026E466A2|nr:MarR family transcriptional regulator [Uliginosibacterium sp. 31-12]MDO6387257.1 MarR family transcriptional regulator [Uliginosibacterium sp. 31-12]